MASIEEIQDYLKRFPEEHKQRWRLAKKLYENYDYLLALKELEILRREWPDRVPVISYLAATHYRMGKYEKARDVLLEALNQFSGEYSLLKHLAKVYEEMGKLRLALKTWKQILQVRPNKSAEECVARLTVMIQNVSSSSAVSKSSDTSQHPPANADTVIICSACSMKNDLFNSFCIRCHRSFGS